MEEEKEMIKLSQEEVIAILELRLAYLKSFTDKADYCIEEIQAISQAISDLNEYYKIKE